MSSNCQNTNRSSISLTTQQKDLLIIHLKGEVYEIKQADNDYQSMLKQVQQMEMRMAKL
jgi:hypothetical protein